MRRKWLIAVVACGCGHGSSDAGAPGPMLVMNAVSVTAPMRAALDSFAAQTKTQYSLEPGASLEIARRLTDLGQQPDVIVVADADVFKQLLMPNYVTWYALIGRNRIVLAYTDRSRGAKDIADSNWRTVLMRPGVQVGRSDPNTDPSGYRTLLSFQLAEKFYHEPGLAAKLLAAAPQKNVRPREADQVGLLEAGELDYIWTYQNLADNDHLKSIHLPPEVDLGTPGDSAIYASASTRIVGKKPGDTITVVGAPIVFAMSIPSNAPHRALAERFAAFLTSPAGVRILTAGHFDAFDRPIVVGTGAPSTLGK